MCRAFSTLLPYCRHVHLQHIVSFVWAAEVLHQGPPLLEHILQDASPGWHVNDAVMTQHDCADSTSRLTLAVIAIDSDLIMWLVQDVKFWKEAAAVNRPDNVASPKGACPSDAQGCDEAAAAPHLPAALCKYDLSIHPLNAHVWSPGAQETVIAFEDRVISEKGFEATIDVLTAHIVVGGTLLLPEDVGWGLSHSCTTPKRLLSISWLRCCSVGAQQIDHATPDAGEHALAAHSRAAFQELHLLLLCGQKQW